MAPFRLLLAKGMQRRVISRQTLDNVNLHESAMLNCYGHSVAQPRAREEYQRLEPGDQF